MKKSGVILFGAIILCSIMWCVLRGVVPPPPEICIRCIIDKAQEENASCFVDSNGVIYTRNRKTLIKVYNNDTILMRLKSYDVLDGTECIGPYAFQFCYNLQKVKIPHSVKKIDNFAFQDCHALQKIVLPKSVDSIGFNPICGLKGINVFADDNNYFYVKENCLIDKRNGKLISFFGYKEDLYWKERNDIKIVGEYAFKGDTTIKMIELPNELTEIGDHAFQFCKNLVYIKFPKQSLTRMGINPFEGDKSLCIAREKGCIYVQRDSCFLMDTLNRKIISYWGDKRNIILHYGNPKVESIGQSAFYDCNHINKLIINAELIKKIDSKTFYYSDIDTIVLTDNIEDIGMNAFNQKQKIGVPKGKMQKFKNLLAFIPITNLFEVE